MAFFATIGYRFPSWKHFKPDGCILLASAMPRHQLERRSLDRFSKVCFDPQLYLSGLDARESPDDCAKLASYPWFGARNIAEYESGETSQSQWREVTRQAIHKSWRGAVPNDLKTIRSSVESCLRFQHARGFAPLIVPAPLSSDPASDLSAEMAWLDAGIEARRKIEASAELYATVAISDVCLRHVDPVKNPFLDLLVDVVTAREIEGVYLVVEQSSEQGETRQCGSVRTLWSLLELVHAFSNTAKLDVGVSFIGGFGVACIGAGAKWWSSNWYKSLYRLRLADKAGKGRAYPLYWTRKAMLDVHLESDFDALVDAGLLDAIEDRTPLSAGLLDAATQHVGVQRVPAWRYSASNVSAAIEHLLCSLQSTDADVSGRSVGMARARIRTLLAKALETAVTVEKTLGDERSTRTAHVRAWHDAFASYLRSREEEES